MIVSDRRQFLRATGSAFAALAASGCATGELAGIRTAGSYGPLIPDPAALIDLPAGFTYRVISKLGDPMADGGTVPDRADGMGCFDLGGGKLALVRNHELQVQHDGGGAHGAAYDTVARSLVPLPGGTTTLVLDARTLEVERQFRSLSGTIRNCAGGVTPWGSWLTCEEDVSNPGARINTAHGWVFEVPANATGPVDPVPLTAMGRFNHEAACVDPAIGIVYETEDRNDGLLYRFLPDERGNLAAGGRLQALAIDGVPDARNWEALAFAPQGWHAVRWVDLPPPPATKRAGPAAAVLRKHRHRAVQLRRQPHRGAERPPDRLRRRLQRNRRQPHHRPDSGRRPLRTGFAARTDRARRRLFFAGRQDPVRQRLQPGKDPRDHRPVVDSSSRSS